MAKANDDGKEFGDQTRHSWKGGERIKPLRCLSSLARDPTQC
ncbi:hypothetical protein X772_00725 [Mesorhizobium sp. LSJC280B00]|nr:hypothetical protein X772_00725 [Mesorhizobium sp. LSJC280B00]